MLSRVSLPPMPSVTTSTVLPRFSNSAPSWKSGISIWRSDPERTLWVPLDRLMGDWCVPVAHSLLASGSRLYQLAGPY